MLKEHIAQIGVVRRSRRQTLAIRSPRAGIASAVFGLLAAALAWGMVAPSAVAAQVPATPGVPATRPGEIVERDADGAMAVRYQANPEGQKTGHYEKYFKSGKLQIKGTYKLDQKSGPWITYDEAGKVLETALYRADQLDGPYAWYAPDSKAGMKTMYRMGAIGGSVTTFDEKGRVARNIRYPRPLAAVIEAYNTLYPKEITPPKFTTDPVLEPPYKAGELAKETLEEGLKVAKLYRYLSGVPFQQLQLDRSASDKAQHGAVLLTKIGSLTHTPTKPEDVPEAFFKIGYEGCNQSNLHRGQNSVVQAIRGFMDDSDDSNISKVGHRQWILAPGLQRTGFGFAKGFTAMHVVDKSRMMPNFDFIAFPGEGYYPIQLVAPRTAWSTHFALSKVKKPEQADVKIRVIQLDEQYQPSGDTEAEVVSVVSDEMKGWSVVIFRPNIEKLTAGRYWVEITGLKTARGPAPMFGYIVHLLDMKTLPAPATPGAAPAGASINKPR